MLDHSYKDNEAVFLEGMADQLNLKDKRRFVFIERFKVDNDDMVRPEQVNRTEAPFMEPTGST